MAANGLTLDDLQIKISVNASGASKSIKNLTKAIEQLAGTRVNLNGIIQQMAELQAQTDRVTSGVARAWANLSGRVSDATAIVDDCCDESADHIEEVEKSSWSLAASLKDSFSYVSGAFGGVTERLGKLTGAIKRIAFYRAIRAAIRAVTSALKEGVNMLIEWDRTYGNNTSYAAKTADEIAAKWREVKKSLGAAAMPIIQVFQPALMSLMQTVIDVANTINQVFRAFQGFSTYIKATDKGFKSATSSAKALKNVLFGFDELNVLPSESGGGASADIGRIDFEEVDIESKLATVGKKVLDGVKKIFDDLKMTFEGVWDVIRGKFKVILGLLSGDWQTVWEGLKQYIEGWGKIIAGIMQAMLGAVGRLLEPVYRWVYDHIFKPIGDFFSGTLPTWVTTSLTSVKEFFVNIWTSIGDWFSNTFIPFISELPSKIWESIRNGLSEIATFFVTIWTGVSTWFSGTFIPFMVSLPTILWEGIKTGATLAVEFLKTLWDGFKTWVSTTIITPVGNFFKGLWEGAKTQASNAWEGIKSVFSKVADFFEKIFTKAWEAVKKVFSVGGKIFDGIKDGIVNAFKTIVNAIITGINKIVSIPFNAINTVLTKIRDVSILGFEPFKNLVHTISVPQIPTLAQGGFIPNNVGSLFIAGEAGAELVTNAPGGTEVLNGNQVEQAMMNANVEVINAIYAMANMVVGAVNNKNLDVYLDTQKVGKSISQYQLNYARAMGV